jgi:acetylglutamate kinase
MTTVLKLGGELLEDAAAIESIVPAIVRLASRGPLVVVHGGGRAIDAELRARGQEPQFVDGLRVTDAAALDAVVCVLAGRSNTALDAPSGLPARTDLSGVLRSRAASPPCPASASISVS